jgi:hypothetical protein
LIKDVFSHLQSKGTGVSFLRGQSFGMGLFSHLLPVAQQYLPFTQSFDTELSAHLQLFASTTVSEVLQSVGFALG